MLFKRAVIKCSHLISRNISYVQRARLLEKIKNDDEFCKQSMQTGRFLLYNKGQPLLRRGDHGAHYVDYSYCDQVCEDVLNTSVALSVSEDGVPTFATMVSKQSETAELEAVSGAIFTDLRVGLFLVNERIAHELSKGWSLLMWARKNKFCTVCGTKTKRSASGAASKCDNCGHVTYPVTAPVGIVSIGNESNDKLLLIRQPRYPRGMYSCIAGFLDAGEAIEDCVRREVAEEVGLEITSASYKSSQHWPFPAGSVMIGCHAQVSGDSPTPDPCKEELEDARWFSREEVAEAVDRIDSNPRLRVGRNNNPDEIFIAPKGAIAYSLITDWLKNISKK